MRPLYIDRQLACAAHDLPSQADLERWVGAVLARHPDEQRNELTVRFVDDDESRALNATYRGKSSATNVLSFPFEGPPEVALPLLGDLVVCVPVVRREAERQNKALHDHYAHMVIHGTLHLMGYDHVEDGEAEIMEALECAILAELGIAAPYQPAAPEQQDCDTEDKRHNA
ncbi:MAG TPA: rRNA maturation RNase YbeY [Halomonas sp.]|nr:rRNA maturation RNase YbeY [Halomonas sp.]